MELKSFKGMPHELGGIDYTENSELEGGEFGIKIGKLGNEYIFDKGSPEGETLSKRFKQLDRNGRLTEDDPISLATIEQIAREESLKHAKRSVNEKGIDPFRNMYNTQMGANGGVRYASGGTFMPDSTPNAKGTFMNDPTEINPRMRYSQGNVQEMRNAPTQKSFREIGEAQEAGMLIGDMFLTPITSAVTGKSFSEMAMADMGLSSSEATKRAVGDDTMTGTAFGYGFAESEGVISNMGTQFFNMMGADGGAMPKDKYAQGGAKNMYSMGGGSLGSMIGGGSTGTPWMKIFEGVHNFRQGMKQATGPAIDEMIANNLGEEYIRQPIAGQPTTSNSNFGNLFGGMDFSKSKRGQVGPKPAGGASNNSTVPSQPQNLPLNTTELYDTAGDRPLSDPTAVPIELGINDTSNDSLSPYGLWKKGGAKNIYGHYANGGGKQLYGNGGGNELKIPENVIMSKDTEKTLRSQTPVSLGGDDLFVPYAKNNTCVAGVNCFEDIAGVRGIPDSNYNNTGVRNFMTSDEGKALFEQIPSDQAAPGDYVQFPSGNAYPYWGHIGVITGNDQYVGDGSYEEPVHNNTYRAKSTVDPNTYISMLGNVTGNPLLSSASFLPEGTIDLKAYYRLKNEEARKKVLQAAMEGQRSQKDVVRPLFGNESPEGYIQVKNPNNPYRGLSSYPMAGF